MAAEGACLTIVRESAHIWGPPFYREMTGWMACVKIGNNALFPSLCIVMMAQARVASTSTSLVSKNARVLPALWLSFTCLTRLLLSLPLHVVRAPPRDHVCILILTSPSPPSAAQAVGDIWDLRP